MCELVLGSAGDDLAECMNDLAECMNVDSAGISTHATWKDDVSQKRLIWCFRQAGISAKKGFR